MPLAAESHAIPYISEVRSSRPSWIRSPAELPRAIFT